MSEEEYANQNALVLSGERRPITQLSRLTKRGLGLATAIRSRPAVEKAFAGETERTIQIALERPRRWEYLLTAELLRSKVAQSRTKFDNWQRGMIHAAPIAVSGKELTEWIGVALEDVKSQLEQLTPVIKGELPSSWGPPGEPGDPVRIKNVVDKIISFPDNLVRLLIELQFRIPPEPFRKSKEIQIKMLTDLIKEHFAQFEHLAEEIEKPAQGIKKIVLSFQIPNETVQAFKAESSKLSRMAESFEVDPFSTQTDF